MPMYCVPSYRSDLIEMNRILERVPQDPVNNDGVPRFQYVSRPWIVCLCGSTRFSDAFREANKGRTLEGHIVLTIGCDTKSDDTLRLTPDEKAKLDELHLWKIRLADEVLVLNVDGYIGESTSNELDFAINSGKYITFLEPLDPEAPVQKAILDRVVERKLAMPR